jgi:hypothetical protein
MVSTQLIGLSELATMIKKSPSWTYKNWNRMRSFGLRVYKSTPNGHPMFDPKNVLETMAKTANQSDFKRR